jgi:Leucine-rich repeat (LRR) protein
MQCLALAPRHHKLRARARASGKLQANARGLAGDLPRPLAALPRVVEVWLQDNRLRSVRASRELWPLAELVYLTNNDLQSVNGVEWPSIQELNLSNNGRLASLPPSARAWKHLTQLYLDGLPLLRQLPSACEWGRLKVLHVNGSGLTSLPPDVGSFVSLTFVSLNSNLLRELPAGVSAWTRVEKLFLNSNRLGALPDLHSLQALTRLYLCSNRLASLCALPPNLEELYVNDNPGLSALHDSLASCANLGKLYANGCDLQSLQVCGDLLNLEIVSVNDNARLDALPRGVAQWTKLKFLHFSRTQVTTLDAGVARLAQLRVVEANDVPLTAEAREVLGQIRLVDKWAFDS